MIKWVAEGAVGRLGGVLSFWDDSRFCCVSNWGIGGGVVINGFLRATG